MHSNEALPIALVSAANNVAASKIVSELIEEEVPLENNILNADYRIWRLVNKYYRADVRVQPLVDGEPPPLQHSDLIEAHIIYLNKDENEEYAERRLVQAGELSRGSQVRLILTEGLEYPSLATWASRRRYELVALEANHDDGDDDDIDEVQGLQRARAALHAHTWRGLERLDNPNAPLPISDALDSEDSCESWGSWQGADGDGPDGGRGDAFAELLSSLGERRAALAGLPDGARRQRAEELLFAFRSALAPSETCNGKPDPI